MSRLLPVWTLCERELVRFYRDKSRVIGALTPPIVFWFLIGSGLGASFRMPGSAQGMTFLQYFFSGTLVLIVLFTSVFSTISIIEDRHGGFLQTVLVAPIPRLSLVLGKVLGASVVGFLQGLSFLIFAQPAGIPVTASGYALAALTLGLCSLSLTGIGFCIAWLLDSTQGFHAIMNLFLIPMWMLSGALFPIATAPHWLQAVMKINPVTYGVSALQQSLALGGLSAAPLAPLGFCLVVLTATGALVLAGSAWLVCRRPGP
ncbi:MAG: ABC transporter permease [Elusimicrobia bacterium]|nr:ABC transporter permease [Elusimicrobiota bacterium]